VECADVGYASAWWYAGGVEETRPPENVGCVMIDVDDDGEDECMDRS
jgi:hypothetical protein